MTAQLKSTPHKILLGFFAGTLIYIYVLSWLAVSVLIPSLILFDNIFLIKFNYKDKFKNIFITILLFSVSNLFVALPGIVQIIYLRSSVGIFADDVSLYRQAFYLPLEWLIILMALIFIIRRYSERLSVPVKTLFLFAVTLIFSEFVLLNIQPLFGFATVGVFIVGTYTRPMLTAIIFGGLIYFISIKKEFNFILISALWFLIVLAGTQNYTTTKLLSHDEMEITELVKFVSSDLPTGSVLAMLTFNKPFNDSTKEWDWRAEPNMLAAISRNYLLKENIGLEWGALPAEENIQRELALGTIKRFQVDYVIWENDLGLAQPDFLKSASESIWISSKQRYKVLKFNQSKARELLCTEANI